MGVAWVVEAQGLPRRREGVPLEALETRLARLEEQMEGDVPAAVDVAGRTAHPPGPHGSCGTLHTKLRRVALAVASSSGARRGQPVNRDGDRAILDQRQERGGATSGTSRPQVARRDSYRVTQLCAGRLSRETGSHGDRATRESSAWPRT